MQGLVPLACLEISIPYYAGLLVGLAVWVVGALSLAWILLVRLERRSALARAFAGLFLAVGWSAAVYLGSWTVFDLGCLF